MVKKNIIFIDANIYLRFYDTSGNKLRSLLQTLIELKENIFITEQICNEVHRNKLSVAMKSFSNNYKTLGIQQTSLPEHLDNNADERLKQWADSRKNIIQEEEKLKKEYSQIVSSTLQSIMESEDNVSKMLATIFTSAKSATTGEIVAARLRKELGNPPGKSNDPLGDQLTWEQFLTKYSNQEIWLITADRDYLTKHSGNSYLNSYLYNELKIKSKDTSPKIHCFISLAEGINNYSAKVGVKITSLPTSEEFDEIISEEEKITRSIVSSSNINSIGYDKETSTLEVEFNNGSAYKYFDVPVSLFEGLRDADSVGGFLAANIKGSYRFSKV